MTLVNGGTSGPSPAVRVALEQQMQAQEAARRQAQQQAADNYRAERIITNQAFSPIQPGPTKKRESPTPGRISLEAIQAGKPWSKAAPTNRLAPPKNTSAPHNHTPSPVVKKTSIFDVIMPGASAESTGYGVAGSDYSKGAALTNSPSSADTRKNPMTGEWEQLNTVTGRWENIKKYSPQATYDEQMGLTTKPTWSKSNPSRSDSSSPTKNKSTPTKEVVAPTLWEEKKIITKSMNTSPVDTSLLHGTMKNYTTGAPMDVTIVGEGTEYRIVKALPDNYEVAMKPGGQRILSGDWNPTTKTVDIPKYWLYYSYDELANMYGSEAAKSLKGRPEYEGQNGRIGEIVLFNTTDRAVEKAIRGTTLALETSRSISAIQKKKNNQMVSKGIGELSAPKGFNDLPGFDVLGFHVPVPVPTWMQKGTPAGDILNPVQKKAAEINTWANREDVAPYILTAGLVVGLTDNPAGSVKFIDDVIDRGAKVVKSPDYIAEIITGGKSNKLPTVTIRDVPIIEDVGTAYLDSRKVGGITAVRRESRAILEPPRVEPDRDIPTIDLTGMEPTMPSPTAITWEQDFSPEIGGHKSYVGQLTASHSGIPYGYEFDPTAPIGQRLKKIKVLPDPIETADISDLRDFNRRLDAIEPDSAQIPGVKDISQHLEVQGTRLVVVPSSIEREFTGIGAIPGEKTKHRQKEDTSLIELSIPGFSLRQGTRGSTRNKPIDDTIYRTIPGDDTVSRGATTYSNLFISGKNTTPRPRDEGSTKPKTDFGNGIRIPNIDVLPKTRSQIKKITFPKIDKNGKKKRRDLITEALNQRWKNKTEKYMDSFIGGKKKSGKAARRKR